MHTFKKNLNLNQNSLFFSSCFTGVAASFYYFNILHRSNNVPLECTVYTHYRIKSHCYIAFLFQVKVRKASSWNGKVGGILSIISKSILWSLGGTKMLHLQVLYGMAYNIIMLHCDYKSWGFLILPSPSRRLFVDEAGVALPCVMNLVMITISTFTWGKQGKLLESFSCTEDHNIWWIS